MAADGQGEQRLVGARVALGDPQGGGVEQFHRRRPGADQARQRPGGVPQ